MGGFGVSLSIGIIKAGVFIYDIITFPVYAIIQFRKDRSQGKPQSKEISSPQGICFRSLQSPSAAQVDIVRNKLDTVAKLQEYSCQKYGSKNALGTRKVLNEFNETQKNGKVFKKVDLGEYSWMTYSEANEKAKLFGKGLRVIGHQPKENILILAETRVEWMLCAMAAFKQSIPLCTMYATLGEDGLIHGINETEVRRIIVSHELMPKLKNILNYCPKVESIIYLPDPIHKTDVTGCKNIEFFSFDEVIEKGKAFKGTDCDPSPEDTAIVMYTSGSTGTPKGVIISHANIVSSVGSFATAMQPQSDDIYLAYLPLAHILELVGESIMLMFGVPLGYSSPLTMTDRSTKVKRGCKGDVSILHPTIVPSVPLILDRIYKGILEKVASQGPFLTALFDYGVYYKMYWSQKGWGTPICNWFVFRKIRALLGGKVRLIVGGGAPLSPETHNFIRASLGCKVLQGYGLTESCSCATLMMFEDRSTNRVGPPLLGCDIQLVDWDEGNYRVTDKPNPRGEIIIGGANVAVGYFKNAAKTQEEFEDHDGKRWFKTGDIGQMDFDGVLRIIDRKKDLVKLQFGEYVSLGKVEAALKICPLVENLCVYADPTKNNVVTIVSPKTANLKEFAAARNFPESSTLEQLCADPSIVRDVLAELTATGKKVKLERFEIPTALHLTPDNWTPDSGLVTAAFKLRRKPIQNCYQAQIDAMYSQ